jgi:hypothetical protein
MGDRRHLGYRWRSHGWPQLKTDHNEESGNERQGSQGNNKLASQHGKINAE